ncbi:hypothetical protein BO068_005035 [Escherichia coli]|nr:hypothetical protein [Salmonella enterica subsp. enterica serovar Enteritidis]EFG2885841.1 hypothetical protein [Escherichia coli]
MIYSLVTEHFYWGELAFFLLTCWATWMTGAAVARTWRPLSSFLVYSLLLAAAVRFLHYALYGGPFISPVHYLSDLVILAIVGVIAYRYTRTKQMVTQYNWLFEKASPLSWRAK